MVYPKRLLNDHETVAVDLHPHWWYFAAPAAALILAIGLAIGTLVVTDVDTTERLVAGWLVLAVIALSATWVVIRYARWTTTHFVITNDREIHNRVRRSGCVSIFSTAFVSWTEHLNRS